MLVVMRGDKRKHRTKQSTQLEKHQEVEYFEQTGAI